MFHVIARRNDEATKVSKVSVSLVGGMMKQESFKVPGSRFKVPGFKFLVSGTEH